MNISSTSSDSAPKDQSTVWNFEEWLVLGNDWLVSAKTFDVESAQTFRFSIEHQNSYQVSSSQCSINQSAELEEKHRLFKPDKQQSEQERPISAILMCTLETNDEEWKLAIHSHVNSYPQIALVSEETDLMLKPEYGSVGIKEHPSGQREAFYRNWNKHIMGFHIYNQAEQVAAIRLGQEPMVWHLNGLYEDKQALLTLVSYSLLMYDSINTDWQAMGRKVNF